jgi:hypothetical protein
LALIIIGFAAFVCTVTTLSLSAISTNGQIKGGKKSQCHPQSAEAF